MRLRIFPLLLLLATAVGCSSVSLRRGPDSWKEDGALYSILPTPEGKLMPDGWRVDNFDPSAEGFRKQHESDARDLLLKRASDDGALVVVTEWTKPEDAEKKAAVFLDRWIAGVVQAPHPTYGGAASLDGRGGLYDDVLKPLDDTVASVTLPGRFIPTTVHADRKRNVETKSRADFDVPGGEGSEVQLHAAPEGAGSDQDIYAAVLRPKGQDRIVVVAYSNTESQFAASQPDAAALARRIRFP
jgi:hypothetical protein